MILDITFLDKQLVKLGRHIAGNSRCAVIITDEACSLRITANSHMHSIRKIGFKPAAALRQCLLVCHHTGDFYICIFYHQVMVYPQLDFPTDIQAGLLKQIQRVTDHAFRRIFNRYHAIIGRTGRHLAEHIIQRVECQWQHRVTKLFQHRCLSKGPFGTQIGNGQWFFQCQAGRHDFAEQTHHLFIRKRPRIAFTDRTQNSGFPFRPVEMSPLALVYLDPGNFGSTLCTGTDQCLELLIQRVNSVPQFYQLFIGIHIYLPAG